MIAASPARAEVEVVRIPQGAGGIGFLPLLVMEKKGLIEQMKLSLADDGVQLGELAGGLYYSRPVTRRSALMDQIERLTPADVQRAVRKVVDPSKLVGVPVERTMAGGRWVYEG